MGADPYWIRYRLLKEDKEWPDWKVAEAEVSGGEKSLPSDSELDAISDLSWDPLPWRMSGETWEAAQADAEKEIREIIPDYDSLCNEIAAAEERLKKRQG